MVRAVLHIKDIEVKERIDQESIFVGRIQLEIVMTDKKTIQHGVLIKFGLCKCKRSRNPSSKDIGKMQYRWRTDLDNACEIAKCIAPFSVTKQEKLLEIVNHYVNQK